MSDELGSFGGWECRTEKESVVGSDRVVCSHEESGRKAWLEGSGDVVLGQGMKDGSMTLADVMEEDSVQDRLTFEHKGGEQ